MPVQVTLTCIRYQNYGRVTVATLAKIDRDYLNERWNKEGGEYNNTNRVGTEWTDEELKDYYSAQNMGEQLQPDWSPGSTEPTRFRLLDDDREVYYGGWLLDDDECLVQMMVSAWGTWDAGAIHIEIKKGDEWVMEIG
jgi:hypothetical protein